MKTAYNYFVVSESIPLFNFSEFAKEKDRVESRAGFLLLKEEQKLEREMNGYMNWICRAGKQILKSNYVQNCTEFECFLIKSFRIIQLG